MIKEVKLDDENINIYSINDYYYYNFPLSGKHNLSFLIDLEKCDSMYALFSGVITLTEISFIDFDTSNIKYMNSMFYGCSSLTSLNISNFNTQNVTDMSYMFYHCYSLNLLIYQILILQKLNLWKVCFIIVCH